MIWFIAAVIVSVGIIIKAPKKDLGSSLAGIVLVIFFAVLINLIVGLFVSSSPQNIEYEVVETYDLNIDKKIVRNKTFNTFAKYVISYVDEDGYDIKRTLSSNVTNFVEYNGKPYIEICKPHFKSNVRLISNINLLNKEYILYIPSNAIVYERTME